MPPRDVESWVGWTWQQAFELLTRAGRIQHDLAAAALGAQGLAAAGQPRWGPALNITETPAAIHVTAAIPGVAPEDVEVRIEGDAVVLSGRRALPRASDEGRPMLLEIPCGRFERRIHLPAER